MPLFLFRPKWIAFHVLVISAVVAMVWLGFWQLRRLDERRIFNDTVTERAERVPVPLTPLLDDPTFDASELEWVSVVTSGTYLADQILVFNRSQNGRAGDNVLTPLSLDDGRILLVNRGFVPLDTAPPTPPGATIDILGRIRPSQERGKGGLTDAETDTITEIRRIDVDKIAPQLPGDVVPMYLDLIASDPEVSLGDPVPVPPPEVSEGNHLSYAFQWLIFAICVLIGWILAIRRSVATNRTKTTPAVAHV